MDNTQDQYAAPEGQIWVCQACGKSSEHLLGPSEKYKAVYGWDESCALNAELEDRIPND